MNGLRADGEQRALALAARAGAEDSPPCDWVICPPATLLGLAAHALAGSPVALGGQDCHTAAGGAHTGDLSAAMLADAGCRFAIVGHSERRADHGEGDALVAAKAAAAQAAGLIAIICVGETEAERDEGHAHAVVARQIAGSIPAGATALDTVVAYEPVWAIGTGRTPTADDVQAMHAHIRSCVPAAIDASALRILYGGSVKPGNAAVLLRLPDVDGALVGGASLVVDDFWAIGEATR
ncbi:triosephosphate isomerase [Stella humosa]|uniref:Triosephosphate isomerase n=2 Tax=Stella humosa TaxID=94 RepID=A0A3N1MDK3_9PROT|nr:triosephosphate isomerase [Stella humosa]